MEFVDNKKSYSAAIIEAKNKIQKNNQIAKRAHDIIIEYLSKEDEARKNGQLEAYIKKGKEITGKARTLIDKVNKENNDLAQYIRDLEDKDRKNKEEDKKPKITSKEFELLYTEKTATDLKQTKKEPVTEDTKLADSELTDEELIAICKKLYSNQPISEIKETKETKEIKEEDATYKSIQQIDILYNGNYGISYVWGTEDGKKRNQYLTIRKIGLLKTIKERVKLLLNRDEYGIDFKTAFRVDLNVLNSFRLMFKEDSESYKEKYLKALEGESELPCVINYHNRENNKYFRALEDGERILVKKHNEKKARSLDERFGKGFDQHDKPQAVENRITGKQEAKRRNKFQIKWDRAECELR